MCIRDRLSAYASSLSDSNSRYHAQHDRDCQTLEQLRKILAIEGLLDLSLIHIWGMERGTSVSETGARHRTTEEYRLLLSLLLQEVVDH